MKMTDGAGFTERGEKHSETSKGSADGSHAENPPEAAAEHYNKSFESDRSIHFNPGAAVQVAVHSPFMDVHKAFKPVYEALDTASFAYRSGKAKRG